MRRILRIVTLAVILGGLLASLSIPYKYINIDHNKVVSNYINIIVGARNLFPNDDNGFKHIKVFKLPLPSKDVLGVCLPLYQTIVINSRTWDELDEDEKFLLVAHELGHCHFKHGHSELNFQDGCPFTIMAPHMPSRSCISRYSQWYYMQILAL